MQGTTNGNVTKVKKNHYIFLPFDNRGQDRVQMNCLQKQKCERYHVKETYEN